MTTPWDIGAQFLQLMQSGAARDQGSADQMFNAMMQTESGRQNAMMGHNLGLQELGVRNRYSQDANTVAFERQLQRDQNAFGQTLHRDDLQHGRRIDELFLRDDIDADNLEYQRQLAEHDRIRQAREQAALTGGNIGETVNVPPLPPQPQRARRYGGQPTRGRFSGDQVVQALTSRGLPAHVAQAFAVNMQDESGMRTDINEHAPIVPGSRGGFGAIQWTGPRRRQLEAYAKQRGTSVDDFDTQMDFLVHELQTSERRAGSKILNSRTAEEAAVNIVNDFLRPAPNHRRNRAARYAQGVEGVGAGSTLVDQMPVGEMLEQFHAEPIQVQGLGPIMDERLGTTGRDAVLRAQFPGEVMSRLKDSDESWRGDWHEDLDLARAGKPGYFIYAPPKQDGERVREGMRVTPNTRSEQRLSNPGETKGVQAAPIEMQTGAGRFDGTARGGAVQLTPPPNQRQ